MPLYEVAIIEKPKNKDDGLERLVLSPTAIIAKDPQSAAINAALDTKVKFDRNRIEVLVRPFV